MDDSTSSATITSLNSNIMGDMKDNLWITFVNLSGSNNYLIWAKSVSRFLDSKDKINHINRDPPNNANYGK